MDRLLAFGYALTVATIGAAIIVARGALPRLDGITTLLVSQVICLACLPAAVLLFRGARRSDGKVRKFLGYAISAFDALLALGAAAAVTLILVGNGRFA
jgi:hypothetical protein